MPLARPGRHDREPEGRVRRLDVAIEGGFSGWSCGGSGAGDRGRLGVDDRTRTPDPASGIRPGPEGQGGCDQARTENRGDSRAHGRTRPTRRDHTADAGAKTNLSRSIFPAADLVSTTGRADTRSGGPLPCTAPASSSMHVSRLFRLGRVLRSASVLAATLVLTAGRAAAQVPATAELKPLTQYHLESWQTRDGLPTNGIRALAQDADGFLWLGTEAGLVRFDGVEFRTFDRNSTPALKATDVTALFVDKANRLWIGTDDGAVLRRRDGVFEEFSQVRLSGEISAFYQDRNGAIWVAGGDTVGRVADGRARPGARTPAASSRRSTRTSTAPSPSGPTGRWPASRTTPSSSTWTGPRTSRRPSARRTGRSGRPCPPACAGPAATARTGSSPPRTACPPPTSRR